MKIYDIYTDPLNQGVGPFAIKVNPKALTHQVYVDPDSGATGSVAVSIKPHHAKSFEPLLDESDAQIVFDLSAPGRPAMFNGSLDEILFTPTSVVGNYRGLVCGWNT